jgi:hypothetical protein
LKRNCKEGVVELSKTEETAGRDCLIIAWVGDSSLHSAWVEPSEFRGFDICLIYNGSQPGRYARDCDYYYEIKEGKWRAIRKVLRSFGMDLERYRAIWIPDEHTLASAYDIDRMFNIFLDQELWLAQPALAAGSLSQFAPLLCHPEFILRYLRPDVMPSPLLSRDALKACTASDLFGSQPDDLTFVWPEHTSMPKLKAALIDAVPMLLQRPAPAAVETLEPPLPAPPTEEAGSTEPAAASLPPIRKGRKPSPAARRKPRRKTGSLRKGAIKPIKPVKTVKPKLMKRSKLKPAAIQPVKRKKKTLLPKRKKLAA